MISSHSDLIHQYFDSLRNLTNFQCGSNRNVFSCFNLTTLPMNTLFSHETFHLYISSRSQAESMKEFFFLPNLNSASKQCRENIVFFLKIQLLPNSQVLALLTIGHDILKWKYFREPIRVLNIGSKNQFPPSGSNPSIVFNKHLNILMLHRFLFIFSQLNLANSDFLFKSI